MLYWKKFKGSDKVMTKERLLDLFEQNRGKYFSGEDIAQELSVSRAAVWKAVKALQSDGYDIDAVPNKGYCLSYSTDILSSQGIQKYLSADTPKIDINVVPITNSTNTIIREKINTGISEGYLVIANEQSSGRGRLGRSFFSPKDTGIYMSLLLKPKYCSGEQATKITTIAAVAVCEAIESISNEVAKIKWVNDIFVRNKKVCGILTEGSFNLESGQLDHAILGIGINVYMPKDGFPDDLKQIAGSIFCSSQNDAKNRLVSEFLNRFFIYYKENVNSNNLDYAEEYRKRSLVIGKEVSLISSDKPKTATVIDIDDRCRLKVRYNDGTEEYFSSGEISIKI